MLDIVSETWIVDTLDSSFRDAKVEKHHVSQDYRQQKVAVLNEIERVSINSNVIHLFVLLSHLFMLKRNRLKFGSVSRGKKIRHTFVI